MDSSSIVVGGHNVLFSVKDLQIIRSCVWKLSHNYVRQSTGNHQFLHRMVLGVTDSRFIDHIDGNTLNNTRENLRICSHSENMKNRKMHKNNKSGLKGISPDGPYWRAQIQSNNVRRHLGIFPTKEAAHNAYCCAAKELHGDFHRTK